MAIDFQLDFGGDADSGVDHAYDAKQESPIEAVQTQKYQPMNDEPYEVISEAVPIVNPVTREVEHYLFRRSIKDVEFQLAAEDDIGLDAHKKSALNRAIDSNSDLIPLVYEGGLKTWECSHDLIEYLLTEYQSDRRFMHGKRVLEIGCGSALPGIFCLQMDGVERVDFQDYNREVIDMVSVPNILLNTIYRDNLASTLKFDELEINNRAMEQLPCRLYFGDWGSFIDISNYQYDVVLSSETIYYVESYPKLLEILNQCLKPEGYALFAAKTVYFGCGGNLTTFCDFVQKYGFSTEAVYSKVHGLTREVVKIRRQTQ